MYGLSDGLLAISPIEVLGFMLGALVAGNVLQRVWEYKWSPEGALIREARRSNKKRLCLMHYPEQTCHFYIAKEDDKVKKNDMEKSAGYYLVNGIYKFKDTSGQATELLSGDLPFTNHTLNIPMPIATRLAAQFHQFSELLKKNDVPIDGFEDLAIDVIMGHSVEVDQFKKKVTDNPGPTDPFQDLDLEARGVTDKDTTARLKRVLKFIDDHKEEIDKVKMKNEPFTWQPIIRGLDDLMAFTSRNFHQAKITIETAVLREQQSDMKNMITLGVMAAIIIFAIGGVLFLLTK
jgi:hypothetical protein